MNITNDINGKLINRILSINAIDNMDTSNVIDSNGRQGSSLEAGPRTVEDIGRLVSASILATFMREFPLTYLDKDERRVFVAFQSFAVRMEAKEFEKAGISR